MKQTEYPSCSKYLRLPGGQGRTTVVEFRIDGVYRRTNAGDGAWYQGLIKAIRDDNPISDYLSDYDGNGDDILLIEIADFTGAKVSAVLGRINHTLKSWVAALPNARFVAGIGHTKPVDQEEVTFATVTMMSPYQIAFSIPGKYRDVNAIGVCRLSDALEEELKQLFAQSVLKRAANESDADLLIVDSVDGSLNYCNRARARITATLKEWEAQTASKPRDLDAGKIPSGVVTPSDRRVVRILECRNLIDHCQLKERAYAEWRTVLEDLLDTIDAE